MAQPLLEEGESFLNALRVPLRAILSSPSFLFHAGSEGKLDDFALATRLSYFLWRSMPDEELFRVAGEGRLSEPDVMEEQVERMLADAKSERFVKDFAGQAFRLYEMNATTPDAGLYPEFDERLGQAMVAETELFLAQLIDENLGASNLVDAEFTFVNRRLARALWPHGHRRPADAPGFAAGRQRAWRASIPSEHPQDHRQRHHHLARAARQLRAGEHAGATRHRHRRRTLQGLNRTPAAPPPSASSLPRIAPNPMCATCHVTIDPPGLAMESFDPIGGFRTVYRASGEEVLGSDGQMYPGPYREGLPVDASGVTPEGHTFAGFEQ